MNKRRFAVIAAGAVLLLLSVIFGVSIGAVFVSPSELVSPELSRGALILIYLRLPRVLAAALAGSAFAVSGAIIQAVLNNPLAAPNIIGVNAGAGFFTVLCALVFPAASGWLSAAGFLGAFAAVMLVYFIAEKTGASRMTLILSGIAVSSLLTAFTDSLTSVFPSAMTDYAAFKSGGTSGVSLSELSPAWILIAIGIVISVFFSRDLDILSHGDMTASSLGMNVGRTRFIMLMTAALLAGSAVSFAGLIGFVGLIVPHIVRRLLSSDENTFVIPASALYGGAFLVVCDIVSRSLFSPYELPLGVVVSIIGVPVFLYLVIKRRSGRHTE